MMVRNDEFACAHIMGPMDVDEDLLNAVRTGRADRIAACLALGADPNTRAATPPFPAALVIAAEKCDMAAATLLLDCGADANVVPGLGWTPMRAAVYEGCVDLVDLLLNRGADPNWPERDGSLLAIAVRGGRGYRPDSIGIVSRLLIAGAQVQEREESALVVAVTSSAPPGILRALFEAGASPHEVRSDGAPVLTIAALRNDVCGADALLSAGADPNAGDAENRTALMHATELDLFSLARVLMSYGADPKRTSDDGTSALDLAHSWGRSALRLMFGERQVSPGRPEPASTAMDFVPTMYVMRGAAAVFQRWSQLVGDAAHELSGGEIRAITGADARYCERLAERLGSDPRPRAGDTWHSLDIGRKDLEIVRAICIEIAYGRAGYLPTQWSKIQAEDAVASLTMQLGH
jgi:ankyrin repeat protein